MTDPNSFIRWEQRALRHHQTGWSAVLLGFAVFVLLWILYTPYRELYVPNSIDIPVLADGSLIAPGAHWTDWFTHGYANYWDGYTEWPVSGRGFTRPAFQFMLYLAHLVLGKSWKLYQIINYFAAAGMAAVAFVIARTALGLRTGVSLLAAALVVLSPPVVESWVSGVAFAIEPLATLLVAGAFFAIIARRDLLCFMFLFAALLTKENTVWAPAAAAVTIMLRPKPDEPLRHQQITAAVIFLPVVFWLGFRFAFFDGIGGTYATAGYTPLVNFLTMTFQKLTHLDALFVGQYPFISEGRWDLLDRAVRYGTRLLTYALFSLLVLRIIPEIANSFRCGLYEKRWPSVDTAFLARLWAVIALAFYFALALSSERYATSVVVFAWPALVAEIDRRSDVVIWGALTVLCVVSALRSYRSGEFACCSDPWQISPMMLVALHQMPTDTREVYILSDKLPDVPDVNPEYMRLILGVPAEVVRIIDIAWHCSEPNTLVAFDHDIADGVLQLTVTLPACAMFTLPAVSSETFENGNLYRNTAIRYELPEAQITPDGQLEVGRKMTVHVRPNGPARFIISHGGPSGIAWFDTVWHEKQGPN